MSKPNSIDHDGDGVLLFDGAGHAVIEDVTRYIERTYPDVAVEYLEEEDVTIFDFRPDLDGGH